MPVLDKNTKHLTLKEINERLKENPDDKELLHLKRVMEDFEKKFAPLQKDMLLFSERINASLGIFNKEANAAIFGIGAIKPQFNNILLSQEFLKSQFKFLEVINSFTVPSSTLLGLQRVVEDINKLAEPMRLLSQTVAMYQTPNLFNQLTGMKANWVIPGYVQTETFENETQFNEQLIEEQEIFSEELEQLEEIEPEINDKPYYYYQHTKTLILQITTLAAIPFYSKSGNTDMEVFFESIFEMLEDKGQIVGEFKKVFIPVSDLFEKLKAKGIKEPTMEWVKNTRSNIVNHKIPKFLEPNISISEFDKKGQGYYFQIRITTYIPKLD